MDIKSIGMRNPLTMAKAAMETLPVPVRFQAIAFPEPQGNIVTASFANASPAFGFFARPLKTSYGRPSPEQHTIASYALMSICSQISVACPLCVVSCTSISQWAAAKTGSAYVRYNLAAVPLPPNGFIRILSRLYRCALPYARVSSFDVHVSTVAFSSGVIGYCSAVTAMSCLLACSA